MLWAPTKSRAVTPEIMDLPTIERGEHLRALRGLERINSFSHTAEQMLAPIVGMARAEKLTRLSLLDIACGGGDVPIKLCLAARRMGLEIDLTLLDRSPTAVGRAVEAGKRAGISCCGMEGDALAGLPDGRVDVVTNSLFLHHVPEDGQVVALLEGMGKLAGRMVVISDLCRSRVGYLAAVVGCRLLSRSRIVHHDGPVSVRAAWTVDELSEFADRAGLRGARITATWPRRMLLVWRRPGENGHASN
jgi:2-polyprenyl-3-methyl-5-hydroxy-6-metoxy-1,4-benzoquinol methylase